MKERRNAQPLVVRCKLVLVGDVQCGKTAMLQVLAKDCYPETYVPTVFENYTACLELDDQRVELSLWDTSGSPYYDNVRPLCYSDSDAVLLCFDISRPDIFDSGLKKWRTEILDFCPSTRILLIGCKTDLRTDVCTLMELSNQKQTPITHEQGSAMAKQLGAEAYLECSAFTSEKSIHSVFRTAALACINKLQPLAKPSPTRRLSKRLLHLPSRSELLSSTFKKEKAKSCSVMWVEISAPPSKSYTIPLRFSLGKGGGFRLPHHWIVGSFLTPQRNTYQNKWTPCCPLCPEFFNSAYLFYQYCILLF